MRVVILCGGLGTRLREETEYRPKPMVPIGGLPIVWYIMKTHSRHGFKDFVPCLGYKGPWAFTPPDTIRGVYATACKGIFASEAMVDIRDAIATERAVLKAEPEIIFHLAAQPLVRLAYCEPLATVATDVLGTAHVLNSLRGLQSQPKAVVVVTSDKCYENVGWQHIYNETDAFGGHDPYSASKGATEIIAAAWRCSYFHEEGALRLSTARGGNVVGGGDWAEDRIVPDCIRALQTGKAIELRNPGATRPWQYVLDCLSRYLCHGARLTHMHDEALCSGFNFGPSPEATKTVYELIAELLRHWPGAWQYLSGGKNPHEAQFLQLSIKNTADMLGWFHLWDFTETVHHQQRHNDMRLITEDQISAHENDATRKGIAWASPSQ